MWRKVVFAVMLVGVILLAPLSVSAAEEVKINLVPRQVTANVTYKDNSKNTLYGSRSYTAYTVKLTDDVKDCLFVLDFCNVSGNSSSANNSFCVLPNDSFSVSCKFAMPQGFRVISVGVHLLDSFGRLLFFPMSTYVNTSHGSTSGQEVVTFDYDFSNIYSYSLVSVVDIQISVVPLNNTYFNGTCSAFFGDFCYLQQWSNPRPDIPSVTDPVSGEVIKPGKVDQAIGDLDSAQEAALGGKSKDQIQAEVEAVADYDFGSIDTNSVSSIKTFIDDLLDVLGSQYMSLLLFSCTMGIAIFVIGKRRGS